MCVGSCRLWDMTNINVRVENAIVSSTSAEETVYLYPHHDEIEEYRGALYGRCAQSKDHGDEVFYAGKDASGREWSVTLYL